MICPACNNANDDVAEVCLACGQVLGGVPPGAVIGGRYEVTGLIGRGGMGILYKAHDRVLDETVVLKTLRPRIAADPEMVGRFLAEIRLARKVRHPNVCAIHDCGEEEGFLYVSMEYIDGVDLKEIIRQQGALPPGEAFAVALQAARGLEAIHEAGVIHRDLKTHNIMRDRRGVVRLLDFGVAKEQDAEKSLTAPGQLVGTPEYMSPEQVRGQAVGFSSDLYSLGIVIFECFTGHVPFHGDTPIVTLFKQLEEPPPLTGRSASALPPALVSVLRRVLAKEPQDRHPSATALLEALEEAHRSTLPGSEGETAPAAPDVPTPRLAETRRGDTPALAQSPFATAPPAPLTPRKLQPPPRPDRPAPPPAVASAAVPDTPPAVSSPPPAPAGTPSGLAPAEASRPAGPLHAVRPTRGLPISAWLGMAGALVAVGVVVSMALLGKGPPAASPPVPPPTTVAALPAPAPPAAGQGELGAPAGTPAATPPVEEVVTIVPGAGPPLSAPSEESRAEAATPRPAAIPPPTPAPGTAPHETAPPPTTPSAVRRPPEPLRALVASRTRVQSGKEAPAPRGFDMSGVAAVRAPEFLAEIVFDASPAAPVPGETYTITIRIRNGGRKAVRIKEVRLKTARDGHVSETSITPPPRELAAGAEVVLDELGAVWEAPVRSWSLEVRVTTTQDETARSTLRWR